MKTRHAFRPSLSDVLEDRVVLNGSHTHAHVAAHAQIQPYRGVDLATIQNQINAAFSTFALDYAQVATGYVSQIPGRAPETQADLNNFVAGRVNTLVQQLNGILGTSLGSGAASTITAPLGGSALGTLQQRLQSLTPIGTNGQTAGTFADQASKAIELARNVTSQTFQTMGNLANLEAYGTYQSQFLSGTNRRMTRAQIQSMNQLKAANAQIQQAFNGFLSGLVNARNTTLFNAGTSGTPDFAANQAQFNAQLQNALVNFGNSLSGSVLGLRNGGASLQPSIVSGLFGGAGANGVVNPGLLGQFTSLSAPTDFSGLSAAQFNNQAFNLLNGAFSNIQGRLNAFQANPNLNFGAFNQFSATPGATNAFYQNGFFSPLAATGTTAPFFNGGFLDNTFSARSFGNGFGGSPTFALGYGMNGFNSFFGNGTTGFGGNNFGTGNNFGGTNFGGSNFGNNFGGTNFGNNFGGTNFFGSNFGNSFGGSNFGNGFGGSFVNGNSNSGFGGGFFGGSNNSSTAGFGGSPVFGFGNNTGNNTGITGGTTNFGSSGSTGFNNGFGRTF